LKTSASVYFFDFIGASKLKIYNRQFVLISLQIGFRSMPRRENKLLQISPNPLSQFDIVCGKDFIAQVLLNRVCLPLKCVDSQISPISRKQQLKSKGQPILITSERLSVKAQ
jgi:hypothetical protein